MVCSKITQRRSNATPHPSLKLLGPLRSLKGATASYMSQLLAANPSKQSAPAQRRPHHQSNHNARVGHPHSPSTNSNLGNRPPTTKRQHHNLSDPIKALKDTQAKTYNVNTNSITGGNTLNPKLAERFSSQNERGSRNGQHTPQRPFKAPPQHKVARRTILTQTLSPAGTA
jgi:hypothetical protein